MFADYVIESDEDYERVLSTIKTDTPRSTIIFASCEFAELVLTKFPNEVSQFCALVIHNGDLIPSAAIEAHHVKFRRVFAVNWLGDRSIAEPLPIGLENSWIGVNGNLKRFFDCRPETRSAVNTSKRRNKVLVSFNPNTNLDERLLAQSSLAGSKMQGKDLIQVSIRKYHQRLRDTQFVLSPPGNGPDCHRTWEAIYCGAVPVVLGSKWPFKHLELPVLIVGTWLDAIEEMSITSIEDSNLLTGRQAPEMFADHFFELIRKSLHS